MERSFPYVTEEWVNWEEVNMYKGHCTELCRFSDTCTEPDRHLWGYFKDELSINIDYAIGECLFIIDKSTKSMILSRRTPDSVLRTGYKEHIDYIQL